MLGKNIKLKGKRFIVYRNFLGIIISLLFLFKFSTVYSQNINFSLNTNSNLGFVYQSESDYEIAKKKTNAFRLSMFNTRRRILVSARSISNLNYSFVRLPTDMFSIQLNNTNQSVTSNYLKPFKLTFADQTVLITSSNRITSGYFEYDLMVDPVGFDYEPGQYFYSVMFTLSEL